MSLSPELRAAVEAVNSVVGYPMDHYLSDLLRGKLHTATGNYDCALLFSDDGTVSEGRTLIVLSPGEEVP